MKTLSRADDKAEILQRLVRVRADGAARWGRMSAHQMVCHLADSFRIVLRRKDVSDATGLFQRTVLKWICLYLPVPWPPGIRTSPEIDQELGGTSPVEFGADVAELTELLALVTAERDAIDGRPHPVFGRMSEGEWLRWGYLHMDHHLRQFGA